MRSTRTDTRRVPGWALACLLLGLVACASVPQHVPVPPELADAAEIAWMPQARFWGDETPAWVDGMLASSPRALREAVPALFGKPHTYLAVSGGGANGAFGAGLLAGWTANGSRPEFSLVTGISTGALIAPFAFLGAEHDHLLQEAYTQYGTRDLVDPRSKVNTITSDAAANVEGLRRLIEAFLTDELIDAIAVEHRRGRRLFVGTTNLDAQRPVIWRIGAIAASGHPEAARLIRRGILASASIPVAFPPVDIAVEAAGRSFDELHVDGGVSWQVFVYPASVDFAGFLERLRVPETPKLYVIRNSRMKPPEEAVRRRIVPIASGSLASLIRTQGIGDLYRIHRLAERDGIDFHLAHIPNNFDRVAAEPFDRDYMRELFDLGFELGRAGYDWAVQPPLLQELPTD